MSFLPADTVARRARAMSDALTATMEATLPPAMRAAIAPVPRPGLVWGTYPERQDPLEPRAVRRDSAAPAVERRLAGVRAESQRLQALDDAAFDRQRSTVREQLCRVGFEATALDAALALVVDAARRTLGRTAYDVQVLAALHLLDQRMVEMATGEGKSLATALAAAVAGLSGAPVHVLTANDYLVQRDAERFAPLYRRLGLEVAAVVAGQTAEERRWAYARPIVVVTARELVFDYLRDAQLRASVPSPLGQRAAALAGDRGQPLLQGLCVALIDEADSVLIDEAQMPLILSHEQDDPAARAFLWQAWKLSARLEASTDFLLDEARHQAQLTVAGQARVAQLARRLSAAWHSTRHRDHAIVTALIARHLMHRDRDYIVVPAEPGPHGERIAIVDALTGRVAEGRRWSRGLHAMVALKEGCHPEPELETLAQMTYQRFFRRYHRLGGLSGTLGEVRAELRTMYGLSVVRVAPRLASQRRRMAWRVYPCDATRWAAVRDRCAELAAQGRAVLVGTDSVADARALSAVLEAAGLPHAVLDARHDAAEAAIVAEAGVASRITVATRMAGRGTDIEPDAAAMQAGGLHVISCQLNASRRLDRQLVGRAARQGQPGSDETWLCLTSTRYGRDGVGRFVRAMSRLGLGRPLSPLASLWLRGWHRALLRWDEARSARARVQAFTHDCRLEGGLSFAHRP